MQLMIDNFVVRKKREDDEHRKKNRRAHGRRSAPTEVGDAELFNMAGIGVKTNGGD